MTASQDERGASVAPARPGPARPGWVVAITRRPVLQPLIFVGLALLYVWVVRPTDRDILKIPFLVIVVAIPFLSNGLHRDDLRSLGLRFDNLIPSAVQVGAVTALGAAIVLGIGAMTGTPFGMRPGLLTSFLVYPLWGLVQQYAMQSFTYRRLREGIEHPVGAAAATAVLFASVHWPNWPLALATLIGGYVWCRLFERHPNLFTLAISHGWLAVLFRYSWPAEWLHNLRIGPGYWTWIP